jgi:hypothetical protein
VNFIGFDGDFNVFLSKIRLKINCFILNYMKRLLD